MSDSSQFYTQIDALFTRSCKTRSADQAPIVWQRCVRDVLAGVYPSLDAEYSISSGLHATENDLGPPSRFALDRASVTREGEVISLAVEATYEEILPYAQSDGVQQPLRPYDYGPAVVVYQLIGEVSPTGTDVRADVRAFPGTVDEFAPPEDTA